MTKPTTPAAADRRHAASMTHSPWSGKPYAEIQTVESLTAESLAVLRRHPTIGKARGSFDVLAYMRAKVRQ